MSNIDIIRAWKDEDYRNSLTDEQRSQLPENPAGMVELSNDEMESLSGGKPAETAPVICCPTMGAYCPTMGAAACGNTKRCLQPL